MIHEAAEKLGIRIHEGRYYPNPPTYAHQNVVSYAVDDPVLHVLLAWNILTVRSHKLKTSASNDPNVMLDSCGVNKAELALAIIRGFAEVKP